MPTTQRKFKACPSAGLEKRTRGAAKLRKNEHQRQLEKKRHTVTEPVEGPVSPRTICENIKATAPPSIHGRWISQLRTTLSAEDNHEAVCTVVQSGVIGFLINFLTSEEDCCEAAMCLSNLAASEHGVEAVVEGSGVPAVVLVLRQTNNDNLKEELIWVLGNVAADGRQSCDHVVTFGGLEELLTQGRAQNLGQSTQRQLVWALSNICQNSDKEKISEAASDGLVSGLGGLLVSDDLELVTDSAWGIAGLCEQCQPFCVAQLVQHEVIDKLLRLISFNWAPLQTASLAAVHNLLQSGNVTPEVLQALERLSLVPKVNQILRDCTNPDQLKSGCVILTEWMSLLTQAREHQKQNQSNSPLVTNGVTSPLTGLNQTPIVLFPLVSNHFNQVKIKAGLAASQWIQCCSNCSQLEDMLEHKKGWVTLEKCLDSHDNRVIVCAVQALKHILSMGETTGLMQDEGDSAFGEVLRERFADKLAALHLKHEGGVAEICSELLGALEGEVGNCEPKSSDMR